MASFAAILAIGKPVAFDASAEERETRGFISMTMMRPVAGSTANWMLQPPVSTPTSRMIVDADVAQLLVLAVGEGQRRGDGDRVAGVHADRVDVLDRADDHDVVGCVAHELELVLLPAEDRLLEEHLGGRRVVQALAGDAAQVLLVVGEARAEAAHGERGPHDERVAEVLDRAPAPPRWCGAMRSARPRRRSRARRSLKMLRGPRPCWIASKLAPMSSTPYFSRMPRSCSAIAAFSAVWPPRVGRIASGVSLAMIVSMTSGVIGST